jgi:hypothetical protein
MSNRNKENDKLTIEYIQFSKRVTRWGMIAASMGLLISIAAILFWHLNAEIAKIIQGLYTAYITIMGVTIGAYQGNSSLEKWSKARYNYEKVFKNKEKEETVFPNEYYQEEE